MNNYAKSKLIYCNILEKNITRLWEYNNQCGYIKTPTLLNDINVSISEMFDVEVDGNIVSEEDLLSFKYRINPYDNFKIIPKQSIFELLDSLKDFYIILPNGTSDYSHWHKEVGYMNVSKYFMYRNLYNVFFHLNSRLYTMWDTILTNEPDSGFYYTLLRFSERNQHHLMMLTTANEKIVNDCRDFLLKSKLNYLAEPVNNYIANSRTSYELCGEIYPEFFIATVKLEVLNAIKLIYLDNFECFLYNTNELVNFINNIEIQF